jgi:hypothetical protein
MLIIVRLGECMDVVEGMSIVLEETFVVLTQMELMLR